MVVIAQISKKDFEARLEQMKQDKVKRVIMVFGNEITSDGKKVLFQTILHDGQKLSESSDGTFIVEHFTEDELVVDITEHELVFSFSTN